MLAVLSRSTINHNKYVSRLPSVHEYWSVALPLNPVVEPVLLETGFLNVTFEDSCIVASGTVNEWCASARHWLSSENDKIVKFASIVVTQLPDLFKSLSVRSNGEGKLCLR